jgi:hypothetical protein
MKSPNFCYRKATCFSIELKMPRSLTNEWSRSTNSEARSKLNYNAAFTEPSFNYSAPAELFLSRRTGKARTKYRRFATAAEAIRYAVEDLPALRTLGAFMQVGDERFNGDQIQRLYDDSDYPLQKSFSVD